MNKIITLLVAMLLSSSVAMAHDYGYREGPGYRHDYRDNHRHDHRGPSLGQVVAGALILGTAAVIIDRALPQPRVVCRDEFVPAIDPYGRQMIDRDGRSLVIAQRVCQPM